MKERVHYYMVPAHFLIDKRNLVQYMYLENLIAHFPLVRILNILEVSISRFSLKKTNLLLNYLGDLLELHGTTMSFASINSVSGISQIPVALLSICIGLCTYQVVNALCFSPLRTVPGPFIARFTSLWELFVTATGKGHEWYASLHERYGPIVRVAPNRFSFSGLEYIDTIYNGNLEKSEYYDAFGDPDSPNPWSVRNKRQHELRRGGFASMYSMASTKRYEEVVDRKMELLGAELATAAREDSPCPVPSLLKLLMFDVTFQITVSCINPRRIRVELTLQIVWERLRHSGESLR